MKKTVISFILIIFLFNMFYPAIYATENILTDEEVEVKEESAEQENVEEPEVEKKEEVSIEEKISEIDETSKVELKEESNEILEDNDASVKTEELKKALKEDSETDENIEEIENSNIENLKEEVKENKEEKIITQVPEIDTNIGVSYNGKMYIETPNNGTKFTLPDNNTLKVKGWAVSNDDKVVLKVYIDNKYIKNIEKRYKRADVDKNITGYGGTAKTPNAGFQEQVSISGLSAGNHALKIEQVSNTGVIICSETRNIVITQKAFSGEMYVETPSQTASYILPDNKTMLIKGWAVSDDIGAFMLVSIDGSLAKFSTQRTSRKDVDKTISVKYGGTKTTSKAGFMLDVDISKLSVGVHDVWITQISRYQKIMCQRNVKIKISHKKYEGKINIESPNDNMQFLLPESNNITIRGWAVSDDSSAVLKLYIDNQFKQNIDKRINRNDVNKSFSKYGGTKTTPKAGFEICADVYNLSEGNHTIKVEQVSNQGNVICSETKTIKIKHTRYKGKMNIETPNPMSTYNLLDTKNMQIKGWAVSDDIGVYMIVDINGKKANYTTTRIVRKDVDKSVSPSYGGTKATPKAGFILDVDISNLADGIYDITVKQVSRYHQVLAEQNMKIYIKTPSYNGSIYVESPIHNKKYNSSELEIKGWALSNDKNDSIKVYLDGKYITNAERMARPDVLNSYKGQFGGKEANKFPGFYSKLNIANLSEGTHTVKISIFSKYGREIKSSQTTIMITNTKTWGIDVSHYQEDIDWNTVRNQGINFAILKIGEYRESSGRVIKDSKFEQNYIACKNNGIAVGGYFYSYAFDPTEASHEAAACLSIISGKSFELPIFLDIEDDLIKNAVNTGRTNQANLTNGAITFCNIMNQSGYKSGVYASKNFYQTYLYTPLLETYNIWLAHYTSATNYTGKYDIWQYTSNGSLAGIRGAVDLNWCFRKY